ncbi:MAG: response regulator [Thermodesulfobacteriota bacterium]
MIQENKVRLLLADDERAFLKALATYLAAPHRDILTAKDGDQALEIVKGSPVDIVVTDLVMPGADGLEVLRAARAGGKLTLVILMTGYGSLDTAVRAMREGAFDYKAKPFLLEEMGLSVRRAESHLRLLRERDRLRLERDGLLQEVRQLRREIGGKIPQSLGSAAESRSPMVMEPWKRPEEASSWYRRFQPEDSLEEELAVLRNLWEQGFLTQKQWSRLQKRILSMSG